MVPRFPFPLPCIISLLVLTGGDFSYSAAELLAAPLDLVLMGVVGGGSPADNRAIFLDKKDRTQRIYQVGDMVAGTRITSILWGKVVLRADGRDLVLDMRETAQYRAGAVAAPATGGVDVVVRTPPRKNTVASSREAGLERVIAERVRLVLPDQPAEGLSDGE